MDTALPLSPPSPEPVARDQDAVMPRLELHIPAHHPAPGERPDFSYVPRFPAGAVARPDIAAPAPETHPLAYQLIGVLDDEGAAVGEWDPHLDPDTLRRGLRVMLLTRAYDERMFRQ